MPKRLKQRVELQKFTTSADGVGQLTKTRSTYRKCWADVNSPAMGREVNRGDGKEAVVDAVVRIRYPREGRIPVALDRVVYVEYGTTRTLNIFAVRRVDDDQRYLDLYTREAG